MSEVAIKYKPTTEMSHEDWLLERRNGIGGSDVAAILELSRFRTALDVYFDKTDDEAAPIVANARMIAGTRLEQVVADWYEAENNRKVRKDNKIRIHPDYPFLIANVDRLISPLNGEGVGILECKCTNGFYAKTWEDKIPLEYFCQMQHYMNVLNLQWGVFAILIDGWDFRTHECRRDDEFIKLMTDKLTEFWNVHVEALIAPKPQNEADILRLYPVHTKMMITASEEVTESIELLKLNKASIKKLEVEEAKLTESIKLELGEYEGFQDANEEPLFTWAATKDTQQFDKDTFKTKHPELYSQFLITKPGSRRIRIF